MKQTKLTALMVVTLIVSSLSCAQEKAPSTIKWDKWGVPHIYGKTNADVFYGFGWAQMEAHGDLILKSYGKSRGRAAEYWGEDNGNVSSDILTHKLGVPQRAQDWYNAQSQEMKTNLDAFVAGMNAYCEAHQNEISEDLKQVLPVKSTDPLAKLQISYHLMVGAFAMQPQAHQWKTAGSNAWAIGPKKSESGNSLLLIQPHPPWFDDYLFFEAHLQSEEQLNMYGITLIGSPSIAMGFNEHLGWGLTFNQADAMDLIELNIKGNSYWEDGKEKMLKIREDSFAIKTNGNTIYQKIQVKKSDYGFIIEEKEGKALALRLSGLDRPFFTEQFYDMARSKNIKEFEDALKELQLPLQNIIYADDQGNVFYLYNGIIPKRPSGNLHEWSQIIPASKPGALVKEYVSYEELPRIKNPESGFVANSNNGPWTSTYPFLSEPENYPDYIADKPFRRFDSRSRRSIKMILGEEKLSFSKLEKLQGSTYAELADRTVDKLVAYGTSSGDDLLVQAADVLKNWDRNLNTNSIGAVLFVNWYNRARSTNLFTVGFSEEDPLNTPNTLTVEALDMLKSAAEETMQKYGKLDVAWGDAYKINFAGHSLNGGLGLSEVGSFDAGFYRPMSGTEYTLLGGSAYTSVVEFGSHIKAKGILSYGNASRTDSPFRGDQLQLLINRQLRDIWFYPKDVDDNLFATEVLHP